MNRYSSLLLITVLAISAFAQTGGQAGAQQPAPAAPNPNPLSAEAKQMYTGVKNNLIKMDGLFQLKFAGAITEFLGWHTRFFQHTQ